jgi:hypothetical protein
VTAVTNVVLSTSFFMALKLRMGSVDPWNCPQSPFRPQSDKSCATGIVPVSLITNHSLRTEWAEIARGHVPEMLTDYEPSVGALLIMLKQIIGNEASDPARVAQVILRLAAHDNPPAHLLLGSDALHYFGQADAARAAAAEQWRPVSLSTDVTASDPIPLLPVEEVRR